MFANLVRTAQYAERLPLPKICDVSDSIGLNYRNSIKKVRSSLHRAYYWLESKLLLRYEQQVIERFNRSTFFNRSEMEYFQCPEKTRWMPFGVDEQLLSYEETDSRYKGGIAFFGKMDYRPNIDAARWLVEKVLPLLAPGIRIYIVGAKPGREVYALSGPRVEVTGFVEDPYLILKSVDAVVAPMQTGGGIQSKVLEAMALGQINVVTPLAARALAEAEEREALLVRESEESFAAVINDVFQRRESFRYIGQNAREFIRRYHTWAHCTSAFSEVIEEAIGDYNERVHKARQGSPGSAETLSTQPLT